MAQILGHIHHNNGYLLVVQDYFTEWADARPLPDQTASWITTELVDLFTTCGVPEIVHLDQGQNFESAIFQQVYKAFGVMKTRTTAYHPQGDGMVEKFNRTLLQLLRTYMSRGRSGRSISLWLSMPMEQQYTLLFELMYG